MEKAAHDIWKFIANIQILEAKVGTVTHPETAIAGSGLIPALSDDSWIYSIRIIVRIIDLVTSPDREIWPDCSSMLIETAIDPADHPVIEAHALEMHI